MCMECVAAMCKDSLSWDKWYKYFLHSAVGILIVLHLEISLGCSFSDFVHQNPVSVGNVEAFF